MSFGFGSGGFGQNNNNQQQSTFGGFGANNTSTPAFGSSTTNTGFGANTNTGGGLFGSTSGGFGNSGGFGSNNATSGFGAAKTTGFGTPASSAGGGLFGNNTATAGSTGFGFGSGTSNTSSPFGGGSTGGLFGAKPSTPFGSTNTSTPAFGAPAATSTTGFGGFGSNTGTALGGNVGECPGTGSVPFQATVEKEPNSSTNQSNAFQSICFQQPYSKFSPEELRLADYAQGRRYGNGTAGATGAFGASNFGGFGSTNTTTNAFGSNTGTSTGGGLFGNTNTNTTTNAFGQNNTTGGFGTGSTGGGLFGQQNKPATGGLFGSTASTTPASGGLFGSTATTGGFGSTPAASTGFGSTATTSSPFGTNNSTAPKPFSFGTSNNTATTGGFGSTGTNTGGFGGSTGGGLFSNTAQQPAQNTTSAFGGTQTGGGLFGSTGGFGSNQQAQTGSTGGLFGNNTAKPAGTGLFGTPANTNNTGGGLFGNTNNNQATNSNPFGGAQSNTGGLFGAPKPAATGGGLFGNTNTTGSTGGLFGSSFGNNNNTQTQQQNNGGGLFGNNNANQQKPGGLFGSTQTNSGGLFGSSNNQQSGGLFGQTNNQQQQPQQSLFGGGNNSLMGSQNQNQQQGLTASITDMNSFGSSMFSSLGSPAVQNPGPLATPLSSLSKQKKPGVLPMYKLNPASSVSRFNTPNSKRGYGFSYSTYGTPNSISSTSSTPLNLGGSMLGGSLGAGRLTKSVSTSSLRGSYSSFGQDSILAPGAFSASPGSRFNSTGSMKKLVINRGIRTDLFSPPSKDNNAPASASPSNNQQGILKKRVSFDANTVGGSANGKPGASPLKQVESNSTPTAEEMGYLRSSTNNVNRNGNGSSSSSQPAQPEMSQVVGNELAIVHEEEPSAPAASKPSSTSDPYADMEPGKYWMSPSKEEIESMNRMQRQKVSNFVVGRDGVGKVSFLVPVDLSGINLDEIYNKLVVLEVRSATVYPDKATKPPMGKQLNVPSRIELYNSWPRTRKSRPVGNDKNDSGLRKHIERLSRVPMTTFEKYDNTTGVWTFTVEHFTTYGLDYDDDETDGEGASEFDHSTMSGPPDTPTPQSRTPKAYHSEQSFVSSTDAPESDLDDTFDFKKKVLPGAFDNQAAFIDDDDAEMDEYDDNEQQSFLDDRSAGSQSENGVDEPMDQDDVFQDRELVRIEDEITGAFPHPDDTVELDDEYPMEDDFRAVDTPGAIQRARLRAQKAAGTPSKGSIMMDDDNWMNMLQRTVSPRKQDRANLKRMAASVSEEGPIDAQEEMAAMARSRVVSDNHGFSTSIDIMQSLFGKSNKNPAKSIKAPPKPKGFEWPYSKTSKNSELDLSNMDPDDRAYHDSLKPHWGPNGTLVYAASGDPRTLTRSTRRARERDGLLVVQKGGVVSEGRDVRFAHFSNESSAEALQKQKSITTIISDGNVPMAKLEHPFKFADFFDGRNARDPISSHEKLVWDLASVLFDDIRVPSDLESVSNIQDRLRKDELSAYWQKLVEHASSRDVAMAKSNEEKAIASLSGHKVADACSHLLNGKNFRLATLIALIGENEKTRKDIRQQLIDWQKSKLLAEVSQPIRTLYELLAGNVSVCDGEKSVPIEDRVDSFIISKRFGLDWRQAFGLRLWYAIGTTEGLEKAVAKFEEDVQQDKETAVPHAWYVEQGIPPIWDDEHLNDREDLLWGLLKIYSNPNTDLEAVLRPENSQLSPLNVRLSWQLSRALTAFDKASYGVDAAEKEDQLTLSFASQLTGECSWLDTVFVLLHLSSPSIRTSKIQSHLAQHAEKIGSEDSQSFKTLVQQFHIPAAWVWEAKALYMRSVQKDPRREVEYLLRAGAFDEAHRTFSKEVAPQAVIERDYETLRALISGFKGKESIIKEWHMGGELYADYLELLDAQKKGVDKLESKVVDRLFAALPAMADETRHPSFIETVAVQEISSVVGKMVVETSKRGQTKNLPRILGLPLTEDKYLKHTVDLSLGYYRSIMGAR